MFSVYGLSGQVFSGTLEAMDRVHRLARARSVRAIDQDGEEFRNKGDRFIYLPAVQNKSVPLFTLKNRVFLQPR